ncbi:GAF domain-containing protein [Oscillochloris sp. ZM17-4]|uniref:GAF domain-containing protein n=1 Tax=Oscillochloris sp. ZM17-4 TaxID=2866714 RepID=UPI002106D1F5|nr:GAF domain-containing protein [Oscillochloris sp. ZM17-4]
MRSTPTNNTEHSGVIFIDRSTSNDDYRDIHQQAIKLLRANSTFNLRVVSSFNQAAMLFNKEADSIFSVVVLWLNKEYREEWRQLFLLLETVEHDVGVIIVFGFDDDIQEIAREIMIRDAYAFACPFNPAVLSAYIEANDLFIQSNVQLDQIEKRLWLEGNSINEILQITLDELRTHPFIGYERITFDLIDSTNGDRYALVRENYPNPNRDIPQNIREDYLIQRVQDDGVIILSDLSRLRDQTDQLKNFGWKDTRSTEDICSWAAMILEHQGDTIGLITLDHTSAGHYGRYGDRTLHYLDGLRRIVGEVIGNYYQQRNERIIAATIRAVSEVLEGRELLRAMLRVIQDGIGANNCTFFRTESSIDNTDTFVRAWVSANDPPYPPEPSEGRIFHKGEGLAGCTLADGKSRIVPHALEDKEFRATPSKAGTDLSMLVVPMLLPSPDPKDSQIVGVISAYTTGRINAFTPSDRDLVEDIARQMTLTIQRSLILENIAAVSDEINRFLLAGDAEKILRNICTHALRATTATEAVIHRLQQPSITNNRLEPTIVIGNYWFPENSFRKPPRLDGTGATDEVLRHTTPTQFSVIAGKNDKLAPELIERGVQHVLGIPLHIYKGDEKEDVGVLFLNKYAPTQFTAVEQFAVSLFASQAANAIHTLEIWSGLRIWSRGNESLIKAIRSITDTRTRGQILHNIVVQAHTLVDASFSYITLRNDAGIFEFQAAWPPNVDAELREKVGHFDYIHGTPKQKRLKGVTGLAARDKKSILINDITQETQDPSSEIGREYIDFELSSRSELAVPIMIGDVVLGVINVEHKEIHAFTEIHVSVVELFAEQAAIALQKNEILATHQEQNHRLERLLGTLQDIMRSEPDEILVKALSLTPQAVGAEAVIWIPITIPAKSNRDKQELSSNDISATARIRIDKDGIASNTMYYQARRNRIAQGDPTTESVYRNRRSVNLPKSSEQQEEAQEEFTLPPFLREHGTQHALCLPLLSRQDCLGVIWFDFGGNQPRIPVTPEMTAVFQTYVNQIALAYSNAEQAKRLRQSLQEAQTGITRQIDKHYAEVRLQSLLYFGVALLSSVAGAVAVFYGGWQFFVKTRFVGDLQFARLVVGASARQMGHRGLKPTLRTVTLTRPF